MCPGPRRSGWAEALCCPGSSWPSQHHMPCHTRSQPWSLPGPDSTEEGVASVAGPLGSCVKLLRIQPRGLQTPLPVPSTFPATQGPSTEAISAHFSPPTCWIYWSDPPQPLPAPAISPLTLQSTEQRSLLRGALTSPSLLLSGCAPTLGSKPVPRFR